MIELSEKQRQQLASGEAVEVYCTDTDVPCVLMRKDVFERTIVIESSDWSHEELRGSLARASTKNGWDDPQMSDYDRYDELRRK